MFLSIEDMRSIDHKIAFPIALIYIFLKSWTQHTPTNFIEIIRFSIGCKWLETIVIEASSGKLMRRFILYGILTAYRLKEVCLYINEEGYLEDDSINTFLYANKTVTKLSIIFRKKTPSTEEIEYVIKPWLTFNPNIKNLFLHNIKDLNFTEICQHQVSIANFHERKQ